MNELNALSPLDGRYGSKLAELRPFFSELGLIKYRLMVEIEFFIALSQEKKIVEFPPLSKKSIDWLKKLVLHFDEKEAQIVKDIEKITNHDVKALEYYLKQKLENTALNKYSEFIHFACTSEDINNLAYGLMLKDALQKTYLPQLSSLYKELRILAKKWKGLAMLSRTHGQAATPTTVGKEFLVFAERLKRQLELLKKQEILGKINGASGNYNAHEIAYPQVHWVQFSQKFIKSLKLTPNIVTVQIEPHDYMAEIFDAMRRINSIVLDLNRDMWLYISNGVFKQKVKAGEVGSSAMPHKVNPIDFENSEGNVGLANALLTHMGEKLMVSRLQRDLSDSTVQRNIGSAFAYSHLAYQATLKGLSKLELNRMHIQEELAQNWEVLAEAIQTVMRKYQIPKPYEKLKELTRGKKIRQEDVRLFIAQLAIPKADKDRLLALTPEKYIGQIGKIFEARR